MFAKRSTLVSLATLVVLVVPLLMGCGATPTPTAVPPTVAPKATTAPTAVPPTAASTKVPPTNTPAPTATPAPAVGGTFVWACQLEPDTLDPAHTSHQMMRNILNYVGATLVTFDPATSKIVPYLAKSWKISDDGLTYEFSLRDDVKFQDGTPMTAQDYAWTFNRAIDPATKAPLVSELGGLTKATAIDEHTLRLTLSAPSFPLLSNLTYGEWCPLLQKVVDQFGDQYGRHPLSVGPYVFKEWVTGDRVTVERNPNYNWAPSFMAAHAPYIQTIRFRFVPEYATDVAAIESGDADYYFNLLAKDVPRMEATGKVQVLKSVFQAAFPDVFINLTKPPLDDVRVRKALNLALDRQVMIKSALQGQGIVQYSVVSPYTSGYWPGAEKIGYGYDLAQAKTLMKEAGYAPNASGMLEKDGQPCKFTITSRATDDLLAPSQLMQAMWKTLGVDASIQQFPSATLVSNFIAGTFDMITITPQGLDFDILVTMLTSKKGGGFGADVAVDPQLDSLLLATRTTTDPDERQAACAAVQQYIIEQALIIFTYVPNTFDVLNTRIKGAVFDPHTRILWLTNAYIETK